MQSSNFNIGAIFVAKNPYSDLDSGKTRPVVIISPNDYNNSFEDVVVLSITTQEKDQRFSQNISNRDLIDEKLRQDSYIRIDKPISISKRILEYKITSLKPETILKIKAKIKDFYVL